LEAPQADTEECGFNPSTTKWSNHYAAIILEPPKHHDAGHDNFTFYPIAPEAVHKGQMIRGRDSQLTASAHSQDTVFCCRGHA
jgi:hypothetical protein